MYIIWEILVHVIRILDECEWGSDGSLGLSLHEQTDSVSMEINDS
jgi:hypothetical protein